MHTTLPESSDVAPGSVDVARERQDADVRAPVFLLSPASLSGVRGRRLLEGGGSTLLAERISRSEAVPLGEVFTAISSLYFRGKLAYARRFARRPHSVGIRVITTDRGLVPAEHPVTVEDLRRMAATPIGEREQPYRNALCGSARQMMSELPTDVGVVLLGSVATRKYLDPLGEILGDRLRVPRELIGLGDMSRGGLLLRATSQGRELEYILASVASAERPRAAKE